MLFFLCSDLFGDFKKLKRIVEEIQEGFSIKCICRANNSRADHLMGTLSLFITPNRIVLDIKNNKINELYQECIYLEEYKKYINQDEDYRILHLYKPFNIARTRAINQKAIMLDLDINRIFHKTI